MQLWLVILAVAALAGCVESVPPHQAYEIDIQTWPAPDSQPLSQGETFQAVMQNGERLPLGRHIEWTTTDWQGNILDQRMGDSWLATYGPHDDHSSPFPPLIFISAYVQDARSAEARLTKGFAIERTYDLHIDCQGVCTAAAFDPSPGVQNLTITATTAGGLPAGQFEIRDAKHGLIWQTAVADGTWTIDVPESSAKAGAWSISWTSVTPLIGTADFTVTVTASPVGVQVPPLTQWP